jgi:hypothetical protein
VDADTDRLIQVLSLEYNSLSAQIMSRMSARYQFLGFLTAGAAILAAASSRPAFSGGTWLLGSLAIMVFAFGCFCFWYLGRMVVRQSAHLAAIEQRINELVPAEPSLLTWESSHQKDSGLVDILMGLRRPATEHQVARKADPLSHEMPAATPDSGFGQ